MKPSCRLQMQCTGCMLKEAMKYSRKEQDCQAAGQEVVSGAGPKVTMD